VKPETIAIIYESSSFGSSGAEDMAKQARVNGIKVLASERYEKGAIDFRQLLLRVKAASPTSSTWFICRDAALLMKQIRNLRIYAKLFAGNAAGFAIPEFIDWARDAAEYVVTATLEPQAQLSRRWTICR